MTKQKNSQPNIQLRPWQASCRAKAIDWFNSKNTKSDLFIVKVGTGGGKTVAACVIAFDLINQGTINRVVGIAPHAHVVDQWSSQYTQITGRHMTKVTGSDLNIEGYGLDLCVTWNSVENLKEGFQKVCENYKTLVICDEHHHAAKVASWGKSADSAFFKASKVLVLTGTPMRSDGSEMVWFPLGQEGGQNV